MEEKDKEDKLDKWERDREEARSAIDQLNKEFEKTWLIRIIKAINEWLDNMIEKMMEKEKLIKAIFVIWLAMVLVPIFGPWIKYGLHQLKIVSQQSQVNIDSLRQEPEEKGETK